MGVCLLESGHGWALEALIISVRRCTQVAFTRTPSVEFDLRLLGGNMTSLPFLEDWLQGTLRSLLEPYTLPDKVRAVMVLFQVGCVNQNTGGFRSSDTMRCTCHQSPRAEGRSA